MYLIKTLEQAAFVPIFYKDQIRPGRSKITMMKKIIIATALVWLGCAPIAQAQQEAPTALPVPRFVTLGTDEVNMRTGPGLRYPIRLIIRKNGLPVEIVRHVAPDAERLPVTDGQIEVEIAGGHRLRVSGAYDPEALARLIRGLSG